MRGITISSALISSLSFAAAQLTFDTSTNSIVCPVPNGSFCAGDSLSTVILVNCANSQPSLVNCIASLSDTGATCYQSSVTAGNAACAANGIAYPGNGIPTYRYPSPASFISSGAARPSPPPAVVAHFNSTTGSCNCKNGTHPGAPGGPVGGASTSSASHYSMLSSRLVMPSPPLGTGTGGIAPPCTTTASSSIKISVTYKPSVTPTAYPTFAASAASRTQLGALSLIFAGLVGVLLL